jgi:predicted enzyme related to lactoylglutathione lyase
VKVHGITASYYWAKDLDRATAFYTELLGAAPTTTYPGVFAEWVFENDSAFGVYKGEVYKPADGVMFIVDDVEASVAEAKSRGVEFTGEVEETPVCFMAFGSDSEGNGFILHKSKS